MMASTSVPGKVSSCVIGFDVWGTLLNLEKVLETIGNRVAKCTGMSIDRALALVFKVHEEAKEIRRRNPEMGAHGILETSKKLLASTFKIRVEDVENLIETAFAEVHVKVLYEDVIEALNTLNNLGIKMGVVGNVLFWPSKYTRFLLENLGISKYFRSFMFSDEVGVSKPDRKIFLLFAESMGVDPSRIIYVGDNIVEDVGGPLSAGGFGVLISRSSNKWVCVPELKVALINRLTELPGVYEVFCK